ncbi:MAG: bifunctional phosphopantothenoylcysteine decarboxylase/phosphopantothenate--cysteine ligase CoaBC [Acidobacteria bacterium]|nr:bifunctional phosphopantothenoylcysteine decarboxylase/phosphopantothenate--cysteine ligase CoaBC [Acidobacteriota bacterium]
MRTSTKEPSATRIVLGVAGGIAAYKSVELLRLLRDAGYFVSPILTPDATRFVGEVTFSALASEPTRTSLYGDPTTPIPHTYLGQNADLIVVAPATAHLIARYAMGLADDLLTATLLATTAPVLLCPAMHTEMWEQPSVRENLATLRRRGVLILEPDEGPLAGGDSGRGRLPHPQKIFETLQTVLGGGAGPLAGQSIVVSAGGTREPIDPVRVITNNSSGRQGHAVAEVAARLGADVTLITASDLPLAADVARHIDTVRVRTAAEMHRAICDAASSADIVVMAAAVADFSVVVSDHKLKKEDGVPRIELTPTVDILGELVKNRRPGQVIVGFAAETHNVLENARTKLKRKGCDFLVVNDVSADGVGFDHPTNAVVILNQRGDETEVPLSSKEDIAYQILSKVSGRDF